MKNIYIFATRNLFNGVVKSTKIFELYDKGIVPLDSSDSNAVSGFRNKEGAMPYFINFKFFNNAKSIKKFTTRCVRITGNGYFTKRSNPNTFTIFIGTWLKMVQNFHQAKQSFTVLSRWAKPLPLWLWANPATSLQRLASKTIAVHGIIKQLFTNFSCAYSIVGTC